MKIKKKYKHYKQFPKYVKISLSNPAYEYDNQLTETDNCIAHIKLYISNHLGNPYSVGWRYYELVYIFSTLYPRVLEKDIKYGIRSAIDYTSTISVKKLLKNFVFSDYTRDTFNLTDSEIDEILPLLTRNTSIITFRMLPCVSWCYKPCFYAALLEIFNNKDSEYYKKGYSVNNYLNSLNDEEKIIFQDCQKFLKEVGTFDKLGIIFSGGLDIRCINHIPNINEVSEFYLFGDKYGPYKPELYHKKDIKNNPKNTIFCKHLLHSTYKYNPFLTKETNCKKHVESVIVANIHCPYAVGKYYPEILDYFHKLYPFVSEGCIISGIRSGINSVSLKFTKITLEHLTFSDSKHSSFKLRKSEIDKLIPLIEDKVFIYALHNSRYGTHHFYDILFAVLLEIFNKKDSIYYRRGFSLNHYIEKLNDNEKKVFQLFQQYLKERGRFNLLGLDFCGELRSISHIPYICEYDEFYIIQDGQFILTHYSPTSDVAQEV